MATGVAGRHGVTCSARCDNGTRVRTRKCDDPSPADSGKPCPGDEEQQKACIIKRCSSGRYIFHNMLLGVLKIDVRDVQNPFFPDFKVRPLQQYAKNLNLKLQVTR